LRRLLDLIPPIIVFVVVMGSIYAGWATATEAAAVGVLIALVLAAMYRSVSIKMLHACFITTVNVTAMITLIVLAASYLNFVLGILGVPQALANMVSSLGTDPVFILWALFLFYLVLGCFMETLSMMIGTIPVVFPLVTAIGIDPVWFGIFLVIMCELSLITPPVGMNLYVVQGVRREGSIKEVIVGTLPFLLTMVALVALLIYYPSIALWLPGKLFD
jgi:tripartite ATP-independent transporter DctM subunit